MSDMTITDEMIEAACAAASDYKRTDQLQTHQNIMRAALAAVLPMMDGWQPISTAPKDQGPQIVYGKWDGEIGDWSKEPPSIGVAVCDYGMWQSAHSDYYSVTCRPTHWRPLPPPPKGDGT